MITNASAIKRFLLAGLLALAVLPANAQSSASPPPPETETAWPGVKLEIINLVRIDETHLLVAIHIDADASAPPSTFIGATALPATIRPVDFHPLPFSLAAASLVDETSRKVFKAEPSVPNKPFFGPNSIIITLKPKSWVRLGVLFTVPPPPPPGPDGKIPPQKVTFMLPKGKAPIQHVVLPLPGASITSGTTEPIVK